MIRFLLPLLLMGTAAHAASIERLRCEHLDAPLGVDAARPRLSWQMRSDQRDERQTAYQVVVTDGAETIWDTGRVESADQLLAYAGPPLASSRRYAWKVRVWDRANQATDYGAPAAFETGLLDPADWSGKWISTDAASGGPAPMFRRTFALKSRPTRARAYVSGIGYYELRLNGAKVGDRVLEPAFTNYDKRVLYSTYDVTEQLVGGTNAIGATLGTGWYDVHTTAVWNFHDAAWRDRPKLLVELRVDYADGTSERIVTDETWKRSTGPIVFDSIYGGENYDARLEKPAWDTAAYDDAGWAAAVVAKPPKGRLVSQQMPPMRVVDTVRPAKVSEIKPGVFRVDFPLNFAGVPQLIVSGPAGATVTLRCGERLHPDGTLDNANIDQHVRKFGPQQFQEDRYTLKGGGEGGTETWHPRFTYHGFQHVEVTGFPGTPTVDNFRGLVIHTDLKPAGAFACSDELLNKIYRAGVRSYLNNAHGYPTDCPTREKNGWTGDAHLAAQQGLLYFDGTAFYEKWIHDVADAQWPEGDVPAIVPTQGWGRGIGPSWDSAFILVPWYVYLETGDPRILEQHYDGMRRYVDYLRDRHAKDSHLVAYGLGDWSPFDAVTPPEVTSTGYYFRDAALVAEIAGRLGKADDAARYAKLAEEIRAAFNRKFLHAADATYANGTQTALSCALYHGLVPPELQGRVFDNLLRAIAARDRHLDTGILGTKYVFDVLQAHGRADVGHAIASKRTLPSWGWWIEAHGATTLYESWRDVDSRNHIMYGDVLRWFSESLAGLRPAPAGPPVPPVPAAATTSPAAAPAPAFAPAAPGWQHAIVKPAVVGGLSFARAEHDSIRGPFVSDWKIRPDGKLELNVTIPPNATATVHVPAKAPEAVDADGLKSEKFDAGHAVYQIGSGTYRFVAAR